MDKMSMNRPFNPSHKTITQQMEKLMSQTFLLQSFIYIESE